MLQVDATESPIELGVQNNEIEPQRPSDVDTDPAILKAMGGDGEKGLNKSLFLH